MSAAGDLGTHQSSLRVEHIGVDPLQVVPALVIVAVTGGSGEMGGVHPVFLHGRKDLTLVVLCRLVDGFKPGTQMLQDLLAEGIYSGTDTQLLIHLLDIHGETSIL